MSKVNSDDQGSGAVTENADDSMGGSYRVEETREPAGRTRAWSALGTIVVALLLLAPVVWIVVQVSHLVGAPDSSRVWVYASVAVFAFAVVVWFLFRFLRRSR